MIYKYNYEEIKLTAKFYFNIMAILFFPLGAISFKEDILTMYVYYAMLPLGYFLFYSFQSTIKWTAYMVILVFASIIVSYYVDYSFVFEDRYIKITNVVNICIFVAMLLFYFSFFKSTLNRNDLLQEIHHNDEQGENHAEVVSEDENKEKYTKLYGEIIAYFETHRPYTSSDFRITLLADKLNSNNTYICKAISECSGLNFNSLVNKYRIEYAKQMIREGYLDKFSMTHIYTKAGFKYQSTFNEIFKKMENITPREYLKNL
jgi:YesN/AraC family two-component response regulator